MITFSVRSSCISSFSVSMPFISGINTSRMTKSGRWPPLICLIASRPLLSVSTSNPSTSSSVCKYFRMLGSSSTTRTFSFTAISVFPLKSKIRLPLSLIHRQQEREPAPRLRLALHPNLSAMCLDEPLGDRQPQAHSRSVPVHAHEIFKNLLMVFCCDAWARVHYAHFHAVRTRQPEPPPLFHRREGCHTPFPKVRCRPQSYASPARRMLERVIEQVCRCLLHFLIIESECWDRRV